MEWSLSLGESWWFVGLCAVLALILTSLLYFRSRDIELFGRWSYLLAVLRFVMIFGLTFLLLRPLLSGTGYRTEKPQLLVGIDNSLSAKMAGLSPEFLVDSLQSDLEPLSERYEILYHTFGSKVERLHKSPSISDVRSDLSEVLRYFDKKSSESTTAAVVLLTDGIYNAGSDPLRWAKDSRAPIYTLGIGDTTEKRDAVISEVYSNSVAYLGNQFEVHVDIELKRMEGETVTLGLYKSGELIKSSAVVANASSSFHELVYTLNADVIGANAYVLRLSRPEGDVNAANNTAQFVVNVLDAKKRIELWSNVTHPDIGALKTWLGGNQNYDVDILQRRSQRKADKQDLVILYDWFASIRELQLFEELKAADIPTLIVFGQSLDHSRFNGGSQSLRFEQMGLQGNDAMVTYNLNFDHFDLDQAMEEEIVDWSPLKVHFGQFSGFVDKDVLLYQSIGGVETAHPMIVLKSDNNYRYGVVAGSGFWQWRMLDFQRNGEHYLSNGFWSSIVQYLAVKEEVKRFDIDVAKSSLAFGESQRFSAELFNQSMLAVEDAEIVLSIVNSDNEELKRIMRSSSSGYQLRLDDLAAGVYSYSGSVEQGGEVLTDQGYFTVVENDLESYDMQADHHLLRSLSVLSGGSFHRLEDRAAVTSALTKAEGALPVIKEEKQWLELIDIKAIFWILLAFICFEWLIRKLNGGY